MRRALETVNDVIRVNAGLPLITDTTELITPAIAQEMLKRNKNNRPINWRNNGMCRYCGVRLTFDEATIDEVVPLVHGGRRTLENTALCCWDCNHRKGPLLLEDEEDLSIDGLRQRWASLDRVRASELRPERLPR